jgi:hypothetical protein
LPPRDGHGQQDAARQTVAVNLVLADDSALGGVVEALAPLGSHIVALAKSEPTLEDVFVELVGRGFEDEGEAPPPDDGLTPAVPDDAHEAGERELEDVV